MLSGLIASLYIRSNASMPVAKDMLIRTRITEASGTDENVSVIGKVLELPGIHDASIAFLHGECHDVGVALAVKDDRVAVHVKGAEFVEQASGERHGVRLDVTEAFEEFDALGDQRDAGASLNLANLTMS